MALIFIVAGAIGLTATILALNSQAYRNLSRRYSQNEGWTEPVASTTTVASEESHS
jgi:hypothetical protein